MIGAFPFDLLFSWGSFFFKDYFYLFFYMLFFLWTFCTTKSYPFLYLFSYKFGYYILISLYCDGDGIIKLYRFGKGAFIDKGLSDTYSCLDFTLLDGYCCGMTSIFFCDFTLPIITFLFCSFPCFYFSFYF